MFSGVFLWFADFCKMTFFVVYGIVRNKIFYELFKIKFEKENKICSLLFQINLWALFVVKFIQTIVFNINSIAFLASNEWIVYINENYNISFTGEMIVEQHLTFLPSPQYQRICKNHYSLLFGTILFNFLLNSCTCIDLLL